MHAYKKKLRDNDALFLPRRLQQLLFHVDSNENKRENCIYIFSRTTFPTMLKNSTAIDRDAKKIEQKEEQRKSANDRRKNIEFPRYESEREVEDRLKN